MTGTVLPPRKICAEAGTGELNTAAAAIQSNPRRTKLNILPRSAMPLIIARPFPKTGDR